VEGREDAFLIFLPASRRSKGKRGEFAEVHGWPAGARRHDADSGSKPSSLGMAMSLDMTSGRVPP